MRCAMLLAVFAASLAQAEDKAPALPTGSWTREAEGFNLRFTFNKDELTIIAKADQASVTVKCKIEINNEGIIKATVKEASSKGDFPEVPKVDSEMQFKFKIDGKKAKLSDFTGKDLEHAKPIVEGEYESKAD